MTARTDRAPRPRPRWKAAGLGVLHLVAALAALSAWAPAPAHAQAPDPAEARRQVDDMEFHHGRLLEVFPALAPVDRAIRDDCAARAPGRASEDRFCRCAVAVVFGRWRANVDPAVLKGLQEVALKSVPHAPAEFVAKQGPQVYADLCAAAGRR
jgi:hypothetical protein